MAQQVVKINTSKYSKTGKVNVDGHIWSIKLPGAGTELQLSQAFRKSKIFSSRIGLLDKKIDEKTATDEDLDRYEKVSDEHDTNEKLIMQIFGNMFRDETKDNSEVKAWIQNTPTAFIQMAFDSINNQSTEKELEAEEDGRSDETETA